MAGSRSLERAVHAAESRESLRELWKFVLAERSATLVVEMKTLGQGSPAVGAEMRRQLGLYRTRVIEVVERHLSEAGIKSAQRAAAFVLLCDAISLLLVNERAMGFTQGHQELQAVIEEWLNQFYR